MTSPTVKRVRKSAVRKRANSLRDLGVHLGRDDRVSKSLSDAAYAAILQGLFERRLPVGAFVSQNELVQLFDVPIQPLRDALRVLEAEGVLTIHPRAGIQFLKADAELARSTYQFRSIIEGAAVRRFAQTAAVSVIEALREHHVELLSRFQSSVVSASMRRMLELLDTKLHSAFISTFGNPLVDTVARRLDNYATIIHLERPITADLAGCSLREHLKILDACLERDVEGAGRALDAHLKAALLRILALL